MNLEIEELESRGSTDFASAMLFAAYSPIIGFCIWWNPSGAPPGRPHSVFTALIIPILMFSVATSVFMYLGRARSLRSFALRFIVWIATVIFPLALSAIFIHRDYFSAFFPTITAVFIIFCRFPLFSSWLAKRQAFGIARIFCVTLSFSIFCWILLMGWAIVTRTEPRWAECIFYNVYYFLIILMLFVTAINLGPERKSGFVFLNGRCFLDERDITSLFGSKVVDYIGVFRKNSDHATCAILTSCNSDPSTCKAMSCPKYRYAYNTIHDLKIKLETLDVGTVESPDNKRNVVVSGWHLRLK